MEDLIPRSANLFVTILNYPKKRNVVVITQRSEVQILPPQPYVKPSAVGIYSAFFLSENVKKKR